MKKLLRTCLALMTVLSLQAAERPNFVFLITDDISPDDLSCYGNTAIQTPNLDALAKRGLVFDNACLTISSCSPSRCSIITGRYPHNTGAPELHTPLPPAQRTFVQELKRAGYHTVISGKNHMARPQQLGFEISSDSGPSGAENWVRHLRERPKDKPFFCWFAAHDAHHPFQTNGQAPHFQPEQVRVPPMLYDGPATRAELAGYYHEVSRSDFHAGEVMRELERQGIVGDTYFIYCSDNGRPFPRCKTYLYDSGIKSPLIVVGPGVKTGRTPSLVSAIDYAATFLELAGVAKPATVQGVSFVPVLRDPQATVRDVAFSERNWHVFQLHERSVRLGDWLYLWNAWPERHNVSGESAGFRFPAAKELWEKAEQGRLTPAQALLTQIPQPAEMLFNVKTDPHQFDNLAAKPEHADTLKRLRALLDRWKADTGDSVPANPTRDRQPLHTDFEGAITRGEFPGATNGASRINHPGPIRLSGAGPETPTEQTAMGAMDKATLAAGLKSHDRALHIKAGWIRDPYIILGPDDFYYLTGTTPNPRDPREQSEPYNVGLGTTSIVGTVVQVWRSRDLMEWEHLGTPFTLERDSWHAQPGDRLWAPELHWLGHRWALVHCPGAKANLALTDGPDLRAPWSKPLGARLGNKHDPSLFKDGDTWWLLWGNTQIAPLNHDFTDFTAKPARIDPAGSRTNALGEVKSVIGHEGATLRKIGGRYVHFGTAWSTDQARKGSYNLYYCTSDKIVGPYGPRKFAGRFLGHGTPFQTHDGSWWCTAFYNANVPPLPREGIEQRDLGANAQTINPRGTTIVPLDVKILADGDIAIRAKDPAYATPGPDEVQKFAR